MMPSFAMIQWLARDREEELRKEAARYSYMSATRGKSARSRAVHEPGLSLRVAGALRLLANRLDPEPACD